MTVLSHLLSNQDYMRATSDGGLAWRYTNNNGGTLYRGEIVELDSSQDSSVVQCPAGAVDAIGAVWQDTPDQYEVWVVQVGRCYVLSETAATNPTIAADDWVRMSSSENGRAEFAATVGGGSVAAHFAEIGHCMEAKSVAAAGSLVLVTLHWN